MRLVLGIGTNLGDRKRNILNAIEKINFIKNIAVSSYMETPALLPPLAPKEWDNPYINIAISGDCELLPQEVLKRVKRIELELGRKPGYEKWSPRVIDIDILLYGEQIYVENNLIIPHPQFFKRDFALLPAREIEEELVNKVRKVIQQS
jgi:2-amino-4-hydroxy-6-hydroxymethyldihydropteridine diphosphokinase